MKDYKTINKNLVPDVGDSNFKELCQLTLSACNREMFPHGTFSAEGDPWLELAIAWEQLLTNGSVGIFEDAVHRIMWGIPPAMSKPEYDGIVQIVVYELLRDGVAFNAWDSYEHFDTVIQMLYGEMRPWIADAEEYGFSIEHAHYAEEKMLWKIRYSKAKYEGKGPDYRGAYLSYENAVKKIIPVAASWPEDYWLKEDHIHDALVDLYGVDYRDDFVEYGRILLLLMNSEEVPAKYAFREAWFASNIRRMPMALAKSIWPENTEVKIMQIFLTTAELADAAAASGVDFSERKEREFHPVGVFEYSTLRESWIYRLMIEWFQDEDSSDEIVHDIREKLFRIGLMS